MTGSDAGASAPERRLWLRARGNRPVLAAHLRHVEGAFAAAGWRVERTAPSLVSGAIVAVLDDPWVEASPALAEMLAAAEGEEASWRLPRSTGAPEPRAWRPRHGPFTIWEYERRTLSTAGPLDARALAAGTPPPFGLAVARAEAAIDLLERGWPPPPDRLALVEEAHLFRYPDPADHDRRELDPFLPADGGLWLDVGCGSGRFGARHRRFDRRWIGIEPEPKAAGEAARRLDLVLPLPVERALEALGRPADGAVLADVLEHLADPAAALLALAGKLRRGARAIASIPNAAWAPVLAALAAGRWDATLAGVQARDHLAVFTPDSFARLALECGFRVERLAPLPAALPWRQRLWARVLAASVGGDPAALLAPQWIATLVR
jgi:2-polyprenyl-3-methyl-5-hydroxy-6-metoxy-1,4-benzoquinol methylase